jgi:hypothetical protein
MEADTSVMGRRDQRRRRSRVGEPSAFGNRVNEGRVAIVAVVAGVAAIVAGASPTGSVGIDAVIVGVCVGAVVWAAASAPWWAISVVAGVSAVTAGQLALALIGGIAFFGGLVIGARRDHQSELRALAAAVSLNVLIRSELDGFFGLSAVVGITMGALLFVFGLWRRPASIRRWGFSGAALVLFIGVVGGGLSTAAALSARSDLALGAELSRQAIVTLNEGDYDRAADEFAQASFALERAEDRLSGPFALPGHLVPAVSQNVRGTALLSGEASDGTAEVAAALREIDPAALRLVGGAVDLDAVRAAEAPLERVRDALVDVRNVSDDVDSAWLVETLQRELSQLDRRLGDNEPRLNTAIEAVRLAPQLLGADDERRYLILFTTPAEARGLGGFAGNYAEISVRDGRIELDRFGRTEQLNRRSTEAMASCADCPPEYLEHWGRFGATNGPGGTVGPAVWSNLTVAAHFPHIAESAQVLYPQATGTPIDGVIVLDPYAVEALMQYTGPIEVPDLGVTVRPRNAAEFILRDQYLTTQDRPERVDALDTLGRGAIEALLSGELPPPAQIARDLGPLIDERRLLMWTDDADEQVLLDTTGLLGSIPDLGVDGGFSVSVNNVGQSKIDVFLERSVDARVEDDADGSSRLVADVTLTNGAPAAGLPSYVIGNGFGLPDGSSSMYITFYGPAGLDAVTRNGEVIAVSSQTEAGWSAYGFYDVLGPGESAQYHLEFVPEIRTESGQASAVSEEDLVVWWQPLVRRER